MSDQAPARAILALALAVGVAAELLLDGHALGVNVLLATVVLLGAALVAAGGLRRLDPLDAWIPVASLALAAFVAIRDDGPLVLLDMAGALGLAGASFAVLAGESVTRRSTLAVAALATRVAIHAAFASVPLLRRAREERARRGQVGRGTARAVPILRGLALGFPLLVVCAALFASADPIFGRSVEAVLSIDVDLGELPARLVFTLFAAWLAGGLLWFLAATPSPEPRSLGAAAADAPVAIRLGAVEAVTVLVALDVLFGAFVVLQVAYLFGGLDTLAAVGLTYAEYARRGFFELAAVVVIVGGLLMGLEGTVAHRTRAYVTSALALVALSGVVLGSSFLRLRLYQEAYGWTELRFYVLAAIVFLALDLGAAAVLIGRNRARWLPHAVAASALAVLVVVNVVGPQAWVTERNLERALVPSVVPDYGEERLDAAYLGRLGADAVPALVAALPSLPEPERTRLEGALRDLHHELASADRSWPAWNLSRTRALAALDASFGR